METYIGVKIVKAKPMNYNEAIEKGYRVNDNLSTEGYEVEYENGYKSWSPKDVFEKAYRKTNNLTFGLALEALNEGKKIKVPEWKGYWFKESGMVKVMTAEGEVLDTPHFQQYIFRTDWSILN